MLPWSHWSRPHGPDERVQKITDNLLRRAIAAPPRVADRAAAERAVEHEPEVRGDLEPRGRERDERLPVGDVIDPSAR